MYTRILPVPPITPPPASFPLVLPALPQGVSDLDNENCDLALVRTKSEIVRQVCELRCVCVRAH